MKRAMLFLLCLVCLCPAAWAADLDFTVAPQAIDIHAFYTGTTIAMTGSVPEGCQVVARFVGAPQNVALKKKGKVFGLLWMNRETLHFGNAPGVCLIAASAPEKALGAAAAELGLSGLAKGLTIEPATAEDDALRTEFLLLKKQEGLYRENAGPVTLGQPTGAGQAFTAAIAVPSRLSPGSYAVEISAIKDGRVVAQGLRAVEAKLSGAPAFLADLAFNHGALYGVLASVIAILGGLGIGLVFQSKGAH